MAESRRDFLRRGAMTAAGALAARAALGNPQHEGHSMPGMPGMPSTPPALTPGAEKRSTPASRVHGPRAYVPVEAPDVPKLDWTMDGGVKVFHLIAGVVQSQFVPWRAANTWGYNGSTPGPTIECVEGDRVRIVVDNRLPEATTMHWHGLEVPNGMDGVEGISQDFIPPGGRFVYEFALHQNGTFFYHSHRPMQQMMGMIGLFVIHPKRPHEPRVDRDFALILQEWAVLPNNATPNSLAMEFNWLTLNGKAAPATTPLLCQQGERVRIRFVNLGMDHHPMHLHGHTFVVTGTEGGRTPAATWRPGNTELIGVAQARDIEFVANNPGDWMIHCHLPHHMMNAMASMVGPISEPAGGVPAGGRMEDGMGIVNGGHALSEKLGPSMGRTTGVDSEQRVTNAHLPDVAPNARQVPGYPQDMFMVMDEAVAKPETYGLRPSWSGGMMGMMTLLRVLSPQMYETIASLKANPKARPAKPMDHEHHPGGGR